MSKPAAKTVIIACTVFLQVVLIAGESDAYTLLDWMRSWPNYGRPAPVAAPVVAPPSVPVAPAPPVITVPGSAYSPAAPMTTAPATTCASPPTTCGTTAYRVAPAPAAPFGGFFSRLFRPTTVVSYRPEVVYRTRLTRVPTTNYRPVTGIDPATGRAATWMQPCTTYSWQFQRVPHVNYRPVYAPAPTTAYAPSPWAVNGYVPGATYAPPSPPTTGIPYYSTPAMPAVPAQQAMPGTPDLSPAQPSTPADLAPSLSPNGLQGIENGRPVPSTRNYPPPLENGSPPETDDTTNKSTPSKGAKLNMTPLPDPDAPNEDGQTPVAPKLIDPRGRTASRVIHPAWSFSPIVWPEKPADRPSIPPAAITAPTPDEPKKPELDSSGWRSVRP